MTDSCEVFLNAAFLVFFGAPLCGVQRTPAPRTTAHAPASQYRSRSSSMYVSWLMCLFLGTEASARVAESLLSFLATSVWLTMPMRISICLASPRSCVSADLILISGEVSVIELPRSSIRALTVSSSSLTAASSLVSALICSEFCAYSSCLACISSCLAENSATSPCNCWLSFCSALRTAASVLSRSSASRSTVAWVSGVSALTLAMWLLVLTSRLRHSFGSDSTCILSCGVTLSSSSRHASGSTCASRIESVSLSRSPTWPAASPPW
mmetsp:Transcript_6949/g.17382  ORF Transcript_6949/g.17382 Transcript_6949/m.17382 type:complete len:268 (-) Transcript_6949:654-1457(-)